MAARLRFLVWTSAAALALAADPRGQEPRDQPPRPVFKTEANYVRVDVYPTVGGRPVLDLRQNEFEVLEDGVPQRIDAFEHVVIRPAGAQETRREPNTVAESRAMLENPRARVFVIFLDVYHVEITGSHNIRKPLTDALQRIIGQDDIVGVMTPEMSATDVAFARRTTTIEGILSRYWYWGERDRLIGTDPEEERYRQCYPGIGPMPGGCPDDDRGVAQEMIDRRREKRTIDALEDLVRFLRGLREERKAVIAISDGWRLFGPNPKLERRLNCQVPTPPIILDPRTGKLTTHEKDSGRVLSTQFECDRDRMNLAHIDNAYQFRLILDEANRANTSFYPIDPRGLVAFDEPFMPPGNPAGPAAPMVPLTVDAARLKGRLTSLRTLAEATDGIAIVDSNDLARGLKRVVDDLTSYYLIGYYSTNPKLDGKFRKITVRVKRPDVQVRARRGYLAPTEAEVAAARVSVAADSTNGGLATAAAAEARAIEAALAPLTGLGRELPLRLQAVAGWKPGDTAGVWVVGEVPANEEWRGGGTVDVMLTSGRGTGATLAMGQVRIEPGSRSFRTALAASEPLTPGEYAARVRARSASTSAIPVNEIVRFALPAAPDATGAILLRRGPLTGNNEMPTADGRFRRNEQIRAEVPTSAAGAVSARLLDRAGRPLTIPITAAVREDADGWRWQTAHLALAPLASGDYIIEIQSRARGGAGEPGARRRTLVAFRVIP